MDNFDLYLKESENGYFKFEVDAHQLDLRLHHFSQFPLNVKKKKKIKSWQVCDWLAKWLIMSGYMDLRRPRVYRRSNVGLVHIFVKKILCYWHFQSWRFYHIAGQDNTYSLVFTGDTAVLDFAMHIIGVSKTCDTELSSCILICQP